MSIQPRITRYYLKRRRVLEPEPEPEVEAMSGVDAGSGPGVGGRVIELDRPFRPANRVWSRPRWQVPKWQYNKLKTHILKKSKKRTYTRRQNVSRPMSSSGAMGPIVITGRGGYYTDKLRSAASAGYRALSRSVPSGTFSRFGTAVGGALGGGPGAFLGGLAGSGVARLAGFGDYTVMKNDLLQLDEGMQVASFGDLNHGIVVCHREYLGDLTQATGFSLTSYPINPGLPGSFPWLHNIAACFDQYEILGMVFHFKSTCSDFGTTTNMAMGTVVLATDYDSADALYGSKMEMENAQYSTSCKPSVDCMHAIECDPSISFSPLKYVRTGGVPSGKDVRLYDHGNFQVAITGMPGSTGSIGELWVTYKIAFFKPQMTIGADSLTSYFSSATWDTNNRFGINVVGDANNSFGASISGNVMTISPNVPVNTCFAFINTQLFGSQAIATGLVKAYTGLQLVEERASNVGTLDNYVNVLHLRVTSYPCTITLSNMTIPTGQTVIRTWLIQEDKDVVYSAFGLT